MKADKNNDKANAIRSKHSVTEQRRRSRINERYAIEAEKCRYYIVFSSGTVSNLTIML